MTVQPFPLVEISGSPRQRGRAYGEQARERIRGSVALYGGSLGKLGYGKADIDRMLQTQIEDGFLPPDGKHGGYRLSGIVSVTNPGPATIGTRDETDADRNISRSAHRGHRGVRSRLRAGSIHPCDHHHHQRRRDNHHAPIRPRASDRRAGRDRPRTSRRSRALRASRR